MPACVSADGEYFQDAYNSGKPGEPGKLREFFNSGKLREF